ncbi:MAG TPA: response regulator [Azospirillum sp.]|nr:response regulator [Azospirillum sp.]
MKPPETPRADALIIIIDDETCVLKALSILLEAWGYRVLAAESEHEAVDKLSRVGERPQAILADYRLREGRTGVQAIRRIRALVGSEVPSIIITGDTSTEGLREARASGVTVLQKPVPAPHLQAVLARTIRSSVA